MATRTFMAMSAAEIAELNAKYVRLIDGGATDPGVATGQVAEDVRLQYIRYEKTGSYYANARGELVFGRNVGGFIAPPELTFEPD